MLKQLIEYAEREGLSVRPGFAAVTIQWGIAITEDGKFTGAIIPLGATTKRGRPRGKEYPSAPRLDQNILQGGGKSHFLWESAEVVFAGEGKKAEEKRKFFVELVEELVREVPEAKWLRAIADCLRDPDQLGAMREAFEKAGGRSADKVTFIVGEQNVLDSDVWREWWARKREELAGASAGDRRTMVDVATGEIAAPTLSHDKVRGLAGGQSSGSSLISFDKAAYESYGLKQSENCALSDRNARAYVSALNKLVREQACDLAGVTIVYWYDRPLRDEDSPDPVRLLADPGMEEEAEQLAALDKLRELLLAVQKGQRPAALPHRYYAMAISGVGGRVMVRHWLEGNFDDLLAATVQWFDDLEIVAHDGRSTVPPLSLRSILDGLAPIRGQQRREDRGEELAHARIELWKAAITGGPIGVDLCARALLREKAFRVTGDYERLMGGEQPRERGPIIRRLHARMGLIKAYLVRLWRKGGDSMAEETQRGLNPDHPHPAYQCGRLMAVYARLQEAALGRVGSDVVQRYYAAASATPAWVLGRLSRLSQAHLGKLASQGKQGLAHWYESLLAEIWSKLGDEVPATLTVPEQSLFALGYYHQLAHMLAGKQEAEAGEGEVEGAEAQ